MGWFGMGRDQGIDWCWFGDVWMGIGGVVVGRSRA